MKQALVPPPPLAELPPEPPDIIEPNISGTLWEAIQKTWEVKKNYTVDNIKKRATQVINSQIKFGVTHIRTHVDVDSIGGLMPLKGLLATKEDFKDIKDTMIFKISRDYPGIEVQLVQILFEAIIPRKFLYAIKWLQCESLSEEEMELIGATISIEEENIAFNILKSLLELTDKIVVFAFDQIESIEKSFGIVGLQKFFQMIDNP